MGVADEEDRQMYINAVSLSADYVLGCNPLGRTWVTGLGSRSPKYPLHLESQAFKWFGKGNIPGIPVYGPRAGAPNTWVYYFAENLCYPTYNDRPLLRRWIDVSTWAPSNEFTVWENQAPHTELFAVLTSPDMEPPSSWSPGGAEHRNPLAPRESAVGTP